MEFCWSSGVVTNSLICQYHVCVYCARVYSTGKRSRLRWPRASANVPGSISSRTAAPDKRGAFSWKQSSLREDTGARGNPRSPSSGNFFFFSSVRRGTVQQEDLRHLSYFF